MKRKAFCSYLPCDNDIEGAGYSDEEMVSGKFCSVECLERAIEETCLDDLYWDGNSFNEV